jgi:hypothetical protein
MTRITAAPSPNNTNREKLYLFSTRSKPLGALDAVKRFGDSDMPDQAALRVALEEILVRCLPDQELEEARAALNEHLGSPEEYDRGAEDEEEEPESQGRAKMRAFLAQRGASDADIDDLFDRMSDLDEMPRNAMGDRKRMAGDQRQRLVRRQRMAADAADRTYNRASESFERMFEGASRIRLDGGS